MAKGDYWDTLTQAVNDIADHGYDSEARIAYWQRKLREAAEKSFLSEAQMESQLREAMTAIYKRLVERGGVAKYHPGVAKFTLDKLRPELRTALDRRILASRNLIKLNRVNAIAKEEQRLAGWATSIPAGGSETVDRVKTKQDIRKSLAALPYTERRVIIDQGHKLAANINETIAQGGGAIAVVWHSHWRQAGYNHRPDHKERDGKIYLLKGNWAQAKGLIKPGPYGYYENIDGVAVAPFCRCFAVFLYHLSQLTDDMLTAKGREALAEARKKIAEL